MAWNPRVGTKNIDGLCTYDAPGNIAEYYSGRAQWPAGCNTVNFGMMCAIICDTKPVFVQGSGDSSIFVSGGFDEWHVDFEVPTTGRNAILVDVVFNTAIGISGMQCGDDQGNEYFPYFCEKIDANYMVSFICGGNIGPSGVTRVTVSQQFGQDKMQAVSMAIHEYSGVINRQPPDLCGLAYTPNSGLPFLVDGDFPAFIEQFALHLCLCADEGGIPNCASTLCFSEQDNGVQAIFPGDPSIVLLSAAPPPGPVPFEPWPVKWRINGVPFTWRPFRFPNANIFQVVGGAGAHLNDFTLNLSDSERSGVCTEPIIGHHSLIRFVLGSAPYCPDVNECSDITVTGGPDLECEPAWLDVLEPGSLSPLTPGTDWIDQSERLSMAEDGSLSFSTIMRERGTAQCTLVIKGDDSYLPTIGAQVCLWDITADEDFHVFAGTIDNYEISWNGNDGTKKITLSIVSLEQCYDTILVPANYFEEYKAGDIVRFIIDNYAAGAPIGIDLIQDGPIIPTFRISGWPSVSDLLDQLATIALFTWGVNPATGNLYFCAPNATSAAWDVLTDDLLWEQFTFKEERHDYRNRQIIKLSPSAMPQSDELFIGAEQTQFTLRNPVDQITNAWITKNTQNTATGTFIGVPAAGDTITIEAATNTPGSNFDWRASFPYSDGNTIIDDNGNVQEVTATSGNSGTVEPTFSQIIGEFTQDFAVTWQCKGPAGLQSGYNYTYTWVANLLDGIDGEAPNTLFGLVVIGADAETCAQNLCDAINRYVPDLPSALRGPGVNYSWPTWENALVNCDEPEGAATLTIRNKPAGEGYIAGLNEDCANFSWGATQTSGGITTFGTSTYQFSEKGTTTQGGTYTPGSKLISLASPLNAGTNLQVQYMRSDGNTIVVENSQDVLDRGIIEQGSGEYMQSLDDDKATAVTGLQEAKSALKAYGQIPETFEFSTLKPGLLVGQVLTIALTEPEGIGPLVNGEWFIQEVRAEVIWRQPYIPGFGHYRYTVKCINVAQIGSWVAFWEGMGGGSGGGGVGVGALPITGGGSQTPDSITPNGSGPGVRELTSDYTAVGLDAGKLLTFFDVSPAVPYTLTLPAVSPSSVWACAVQNNSSNDLTIDPNGNAIDENTGTLILPPGAGVDIYSDGTDYFTERGFGTGSGGAPYDAVFSYPGAPPNATLLELICFSRSVEFPGNFAGSVGFAGQPPTGTVVYTISKNGATCGTVTINSGGAFTFATTGGLPVTFDAGDTLAALTPATDGTLASVTITFSGATV
jgi:hypothetical protein